jgi:hypothetical protein
MYHGLFFIQKNRKIDLSIFCDDTHHAVGAKKMVAIASMRTLDGWLVAHWMRQGDTEPLTSVVSDLEPNVMTR